MGIPRIYWLCVALFFAAPLAAAPITVDLGPTDFRRWGSGTGHHSLDGLRVSTGQAVRMPPTNSSLSLTRNSLVPYSGISNALKKAARATPAQVAASLAIATVFTAVDWVMTDGVVTKEQVTSPDFDNSFYHWTTNDQGYIGRGMSPVTACQDLASQLGSRYQFSSIGTSTGGQPNCRLLDTRFNSYNTSSMTSVGSGCPTGFTYDSQAKSCAAYLPVPVSDAEFDTQLPPVLESMTPTQLLAAIGALISTGIKQPDFGSSELPAEGPSSSQGESSTTTSTNANGDTVVTETTVTNNYDYSETTVTNSPTTVTTTYVNGQVTNTETTTTTPGDAVVSPSTELPGFCDWASVVCDWIDWTQEEPTNEPDISGLISDEDFEQSTDISFGTKSCPPPQQIQLAFPDTIVDISYQPLCDFANIIYFMVMAASYITAAYISLGVSRG